ncbi:MAG: MHS family MFS transporter [Alphaproteobacteria bacterium]|nr:MHS family MFS transporter [Alphaproteobacteria bacterium]
MQEAQQRSLTKEQKEAVGILSIGTFFEQFDIMLYIHMAVLLNELFFPQTDQNVASLLSAFTFCSTFIFIPIGALIFGWVGDNIGRKSTVVLTTLLTALSCLTIAFLPTYAEIGIKASIIMIGCRILQSIASMGEVIGALVYITEFTKPPIRYYAVALIPVLGYSGGLAALGIASLIVYAEVNWRGIFVFGALIALVGIAIRTKLSETKDFANASKRLQTQYNVNPDEEDLFYDESYKKTSFAMFCTQCTWPLCFYFVFIYCSQILKSQFEYSVLDIIKHNFVISIFPVVSCFIRAKLSKRLHPLILFKYSLIISFFFFIIIAFYLDSSPNPLGIGIFQSLLLMFTPNGYSESSVIFPHFPVFKRFQSACLSYAFSRAFMYIATSFGLILIIKLIGISWGLIFATSCVSAIGAYGCFYFLRLEQKNIMI